MCVCMCVCVCVCVFMLLRSSCSSSSNRSNSNDDDDVDDDSSSSSSGSSISSSSSNSSRMITIITKIIMLCSSVPSAVWTHVETAQEDHLQPSTTKAGVVHNTANNTAASAATV